MIKSHRNIWSNLEDRKQLKLTNHADGIEGSSTNKSQDSIKTKSESQVSIDEIAALEILNDLKSDGQMKNSEKLVINQNMPLDSNFKENTIDYEQVPVSDFGMAMLRGMGWNPDSGIGKQPR